MHPKQQQDKVLIVYHGPHCIDGFTSAWVTSRFAIRQGYEFELYPISYGDKNIEELIRLVHETELDYARIYIVDFSLNIDDMKLLAGVTHSPIVMLDHHKSAFENYGYAMDAFSRTSSFQEFYESNQVMVVLDNAQSGAGLCWSYFNSSDEEMPWLVKYVQDRDIWAYEYPDTLAIHMYLDTREKSIAEWTVLYHALENSKSAEAIKLTGNELLIAHNNFIREVAEKAMPCKIFGEPGLMVECDLKYASDLGSILATECGTYGLIYCEADNGDTIKCSLRSENGKDFDVERLARLLGGGGHKHAAGFTVDMSVLVDKFFDRGITEELDFNA